MTRMVAIMFSLSNIDKHVINNPLLENRLDITPRKNMLHDGTMFTRRDHIC